MLGDLLHLCASLLGQGMTLKTGRRNQNSAGKKGRNGKAKCKQTTVVQLKGVIGMQEGRDRCPEDRKTRQRR